jgi:hypothetical protein
VKHKLKSLKRKNLNRRKKIKTGSIDSSAAPTNATPSDDEHMYDDYAESTSEHGERSDLPQIDDEMAVTNVSPTVGFIFDSSTPLFGSAITSLDPVISHSSPMLVDPPIPPQLPSQMHQSDLVSSQSSKRRKRSAERKRFEETRDGIRSNRDRFEGDPDPNRTPASPLRYRSLRECGKSEPDRLTRFNKPISGLGCDVA